MGNKNDILKQEQKEQSPSRERGALGGLRDQHFPASLVTHAPSLSGQYNNKSFD
jgi:hypothetical protein